MTRPNGSLFFRAELFSSSIQNNIHHFSIDSRSSPEKPEAMLRVTQPASAAQPEAFYSIDERHYIVFKHPGYPDFLNQNELLQLFGTDNAEGGLHHGTALLACAIIAGNSWNGYLTQERDGRRIDIEQDGLLTAKHYYFHVPPSTDGASDELPYPIYPSFQHWSFPHDDLPLAWSQFTREEQASTFQGVIPPSNLSEAVLYRDQGCIVTRHGDYCTSSHICPKSETEWFNSSGLSVYNLNQMLPRHHTINDISNAISLRWDVHRAFDDRKFVILPKEGSWVIHFLSPTKDLGKLYHNTAVRLPPNVATTNLLARFAWSIFHSLRLLDGRGRRHLRLRTEENGRILEIVKDVNLQDWHRSQAQSSSRSISPKKRRHLSEDDEATNLREQHELRGRKRWRSQHWLDGGGAKADLDSVSTQFKKRSRVVNEDELTPSATPLSETSHVGALGARDANASESQSITTTSSTTVPLGVIGEASGLQNIEDVRFAIVKVQRPTDSNLLCCDYEAADATALAGGLGQSLCHKCLGFEFWDDRLNDFNAEEM